MKKKHWEKTSYYGVIIFTLLIVTGAYFYRSRCNHNGNNFFQGGMSFDQLMPHLDEFYKDKSGFGIPNEEENMIWAAGGSPTYGEISYKAVDTILKDLVITNNDVFYDLGSGVGKVILHAYLGFPFKKMVGIELSEKRYSQSREAQNLLEKKGFKNSDRELSFLKEDFTQSNIGDATVVYMGSTCYSQDIMNILVKKLAKLKKGLRVMTLKRLPEAALHGFTLIKEYRLPMSWSKASPVFVYALG